ncbi:hypothetical protein BDP27DRAFT_1424201 [Rhodocollybia butyracea]|uniref:F-box domain-containing protein n=1 Tax=Rhodocollybia butyracea TaxID=206335 RepID=A0A9P5PLH4_9AGAR|nr:hypothetical protein BDP27DRAFT_1424201 [Rhodocollybia butyracea]
MANASEEANDLLSIPPEIIQHILVFCLPKDLAAFSKACRLTRELIYGSEDQHIWREIFLNLYDDPRKSLITGESSFSVNWKNELQRRTEAESVARRAPDVEPHEHVSERLRALETFISAVQQALPAAKADENAEPEPSLNLQWLDKLLKDSRMLSSAPLLTEIHLHSRLRAYISLTHELSTDEGRITVRRIQSRCFVYDIRNYKAANDWGAFMTDGSVNWQHIDHLAVVVLTNLRELPVERETIATKPPLGLLNTRPLSAPGPYFESDWAGVEGTWRRYVCFMDYRDLFAFNFSPVANGPRNPLFFHDSRFREATRLIEVKLHLVSKSELVFHEPPRYGNVNPRYPMLCFSGTSCGANGHEAKVEGHVRIGIDGSIRWTFYDLMQGSVHNNSTLWCSQGVQLGGIASAAGIVGSWSTSVHDQGDPVGPFWLWKVSQIHADPSDLMDFT